VISGEIGPSSSAMVNIDNELSVVSGADMAWVEETGFWSDSKTNQMNPRKWRVWAITPKSQIDVQ
jgi:hypothetical protein